MKDCQYTSLCLLIISIDWHYNKQKNYADEMMSVITVGEKIKKMEV
jgi:hypothetical protein